MFKRHVRGSGFASKFGWIIAGGLMALLVNAANAAAGNYTILYSFCQSGKCIYDGASPEAGLVADSAGNLFGTAYLGGIAYGCGGPGCGTAFELSPKGSGKYAFSVMHRFCGQKGCDDGGLSLAPMIVDTIGNLYGTTNVGGEYGAGSVFELVLNSDGTYTFTVLHHFCVETNCTDGAAPQFDGLTYQGRSSGAPYDGTSPLYGTAFAAGTIGYGLVYRLMPPGPGKTKWREDVLYNFCSQTNCADGRFPAHGLLLDRAGNLYGNTDFGGTTDNGVIFELSKSGKTWNETVLYNVCPDGGSCTDGELPASPLTMDASGNLYGTLANGATNGSGVLFKLVPNGTNSTFSVVHGFCGASGCTDGDEPWGPLLIDGAGNIFGTTELGGAFGFGTIYEFSGGSIDVLHSFCRKSGCIDGAAPTGGVISDASGNLYGTTTDGCETCAGHGTVFRLTR